MLSAGEGVELVVAWDVFRVHALSLLGESKAGRVRAAKRWRGGGGLAELDLCTRRWCWVLSIQRLTGE